MIPEKDPKKFAMKFVADIFTTVESHDLSVRELEMGIDFYNIIKQKGEIDFRDEKEILWGAIIIKIIRNGFIIARSEKKYGQKNMLYHNIYEPYYRLDYTRFHDLEDPECEICKQLIESNFDYDTISKENKK